MDRTQQPEYVPVGLHVDMNVQLKLPDLYQILDKQVVQWYQWSKYQYKYQYLLSFVAC